MLISVIIPVFNGETFLAEAVESIWSQEYDPLEIIIVDDGSTDRSAEVASKLSGDIRLVRQENKGIAAARNTGLRQSRGEIIAFLDQDDLWPEDKLELLLPHFSQDPALGAVYGFMQMMRLVAVDGAGHQYEHYLEPMFSWHMGAGLFKRSLFEQVGVFDDTLRYYVDDLDFFLRVRELAVSLKYVKDITLYYRFHGENASLNMDAPVGSFFVEAIKRSLDRRRQAEIDDLSPLPDFVRRRADDSE